MILIRRRRWLSGFILGLGPVAASQGQGLPPALPPVDPPVAASGPAVAPLPIVRPAPTVVAVPPDGMRPTWALEPLDPVALERKHRPGFVQLKARSWHWRRLQGKLWGYPEEYEPRPLGAAVYDFGRIMAANGAAASLVLHHYDFVDGSSELTTRGTDQLARHAAQMAASPFPLIVERTPENPALAETRRYAVLALLARGPCPVSSDRVLVGVPRAHGQSGPDAQVVAGNSLGRTQQYGPPIPILSNGVNSPSGVTSSNSSGTGMTP